MFLTPHCFIVNNFIILSVVFIYLFIYWLAGLLERRTSLVLISLLFSSLLFSSLLFSPDNNNNNRKVDTVL